MDVLNKENRKIIITGMGTITALGNGISSLREALKNGTSCFFRNHHFPQLSFPIVSASLENFNFENIISSGIDIPDEIRFRALKAGRRAPRAIQTSLIVALEAYQQAQLFHRSINPARIGLVVAGQNTTQSYSYNLYTSFQQEPDYLSPMYALHFMDSDQIGTLSEVFNIQGEGFTVGAASATGNIGLIQAYRMLKQGHIDICMVVGVMADLSPLEVQGFYNIGAMGGRNFSEQPLKACRPFDRDREGFIWGQGCGCIVLEVFHSESTTSLGTIKGVGIALDAERYAEPNFQGESRAMWQAMREADIGLQEIQYINTHGSSSMLGDETEIKAMHNVFKENIFSIWLNATKGLVGHCLWSAGVIEAIVTLLQMQENFLHPNLNLENPIDSRLRWVGAHSIPADIKFALNNSFGFGGINSSILFSKER